MRRLITIFLYLAVASLPAIAQTAVLMPLPRYFAVDPSTGQLEAGGCVFTYQAGTTTPLVTYNSSSGAVPNANPVKLDSGGSASIWLSTGQAYTIVLWSDGSPDTSNCSNGTQIWTQDNVTGIATQVTTSFAATTTVTYSATPTFTGLAQNQLFKMTLTGNVTSSTLVMTGLSTPATVTFEITQDGAGSHTFAWPTNVLGAAVVSGTASQTTNQTFTWDGTNAVAVGPATYGGPAWNVSNSAGDASFGVSSTNGVQTSNLSLLGVVSNSNNGEGQIQMAGASPFGFRICRAGNSCPFKVSLSNSSAPSGLFDIGTITNTVSINTGTAGDASFSISAGNGVNSTATSFQGVVSGGNNGEARWTISTATPFGFRFFANSNEIMRITGTAPASSLFVNADGTVSIPNAVKTGTSANTDQAGTCTLGTNCSPARSFAATYASAPICVCSDTSAIQACRVQVTTSALTITGNAADVIDYLCIPRN